MWSCLQADDINTNRHVQAYHCTVPLCVRASLCIMCFLSSFCFALFCVSFDFVVHQYVLVSKLGLWLSTVDAGLDPARNPPPPHLCLSVAYVGEHNQKNGWPCVGCPPHGLICPAHLRLPSPLPQPLHCESLPAPGSMSPSSSRAGFLEGYGRRPGGSCRSAALDAAATPIQPPLCVPRSPPVSLRGCASVREPCHTEVLRAQLHDKLDPEAVINFSDEDNARTFRERTFSPSLPCTDSTRAGRRPATAIPPPVLVPRHSVSPPALPIAPPLVPAVGPHPCPFSACKRRPRPTLLRHPRGGMGR